MDMLVLGRESIRCHRPKGFLCYPNQRCR